MKIVRRDLDRHDRLLREHTLHVQVVSRQEGDSYLREQLSRGFDSHGFDQVQNCWWGRHDNGDQISRFFIEP